MNINYDFTFIKGVFDSILTLVLVIATGILTYYTYLLVSEARKARRATIQPYISFTLEQAETDVTLLFMVFKNIGQGAAYDLHFEIQEDFRHEAVSKLGELGLFKEGMKFCPPNYSKKFLVAETSYDYKEKMKEEAVFEVKYKNVYGEFDEQHFNVKLKEQIKSSSVTPSDTYVGRISEYMKEMKDIFKQQAKNDN